MQLKDGLPTVLFVGRLVPYKGVEFLIRALEDVKARLWIVGTGPLENSLKNLVREKGMADRVVFLGHVSDEDLVAYYHACDVFALPSITNQEMFGLVQLEAMACRKPVISTTVPTGVPWVNQHGKTGYTVTPGNSAELAHAIQRLLSSREFREEMGAAGRARVEQPFHFGQDGGRYLAGLPGDTQRFLRGPAKCRGIRDSGQRGLLASPNPSSLNEPWLCVRRCFPGPRNSPLTNALYQGATSVVPITRLFLSESASAGATPLIGNSPSYSAALMLDW